MQRRILYPLGFHTRFLTFHLKGDPKALKNLETDDDTVIGVGPAVAPVKGLRWFPTDIAAFPSTQAALFVALSHADKGTQLDASLNITRALKGAFAIVEEIDAFQYKDGRDLSGFVDGTENPHGDVARRAAIIDGQGPGLDGGSFVAVQRWVHDVDTLDRMSTEAKEMAIGRRLDDDKEITGAPPSAHVKRTAQESFDPDAFMLRRSLPYGNVHESGLYFIAYVENLDRFERPLRRMAGLDDGVVDGILSFTRAVTGGYYFCPPLVDGRLDLRALGM